MSGARPSRLIAATGAALLGIGLPGLIWSLPAVRAAPAPDDATVAAGPVAHIPPPAFDPPAAARTGTAVLAGGCFWGVQGVFQHVKGVTAAVAGYSGGTRATADYGTVSNGGTGHAESVMIRFDPAVVSYGRLLQIYFALVADPTTLDRQGPDSGTQYRTALFPTSPAQAKVAAAYIAQLGRAGAWPRPIVTRIEPYKGFFPAEAYHQDYLTLHPDSPYIRYNDLPKVAALRRAFPALYRARPVLVNAKG